MGLAITAAFAFALWVTLWSLGAKALDGMLLVIVILLTGVVAKMVSRVLPGNRRRS